MAWTPHSASISTRKTPFTTKKTDNLHGYTSNRHTNNSKSIIIHYDQFVPNSSISIYIQRFLHDPSKTINTIAQHPPLNSLEHTVNSSKVEPTAAIDYIIRMRAKWTRRPQEEIKKIYDPRREEGGNSEGGGSGVEKEEERVGGG